ncbi:MAG TPA: benzoate-CoA ligase family protein [Terriglobales bacterium]|nr:benzoate-CoA ligase family protein [Terriglobales bacterium]
MTTFNAATYFVDRHLAEGRGARVAHRTPGGPVTWAAVAAAADRWGNGLADLGGEIENRVLLVLDDSPAFAAVFWGTVKLGAVAVPVNPLMSAEDYEFLLNDSRAKVAVVEERAAARILAVRERCPFLRAVVVAGRADRGALALDDLLGRARPSLSAAPTHADDIMYWGYTSGSTGRPKAAVHSHAHFRAAAELVGTNVFGLGPDDVVFSASKMYFAFGLGNTLYFPAHAGAASVLVPSRVEPEGAFEVIARERPTVFCTVPTLYARMLAVPDAARRYDLSSLRFCVSSGEALPPAVFDAWRDTFGITLHDVVGSTEALHDFIASRPGRARRGAVGELVDGFEARLVDDEGNDVAPGSVGHLLIKGPTTAPYYWNRVERTQSTMLGAWLRTGDMMTRDADGYFRFVGRGDDMLRVSGQWVSPTEIEARLVEHPLVLEAAVVGREATNGLTEPRACVVLRSGAGTPSVERELTDWLRAGLAHYKVPRAVDFVAELPKTATGKIQRFRLRADG